jgi:hypothetical protein
MQALGFPGEHCLAAGSQAYPRMQPVCVQSPGWHVPFGPHVFEALQSAGWPQKVTPPPELDDELDVLLAPPAPLELELEEGRGSQLADWSLPMTQ